MKFFIINDKEIKQILDSLTISKEARDVIDSITLRFDYNYVNFVYSVFSVYTTYYCCVGDENSSVFGVEAQQIYDKYADANLNIDRRNVFVADIYDIMYTVSCFDKDRFKDYFYEDIYNRLENVLGVENATIHMEEVFDSMETLFNAIEACIIASISPAEDLTGNVVMYLEIHQHGLMFYLL